MLFSGKKGQSSNAATASNGCFIAFNTSSLFRIDSAWLPDDHRWRSDACGRLQVSTTPERSLVNDRSGIN
jgi:hypothetical protein